MRLFRLRPHLLAMIPLLFACASCASLDPGKVDVQLPETLPTQKITTYTEALHNLGLMSEIYDTAPLKIQSNPIGDNTGTSASTGGEIPRDITEMIKSVLNSIGGKVTFIPYDPAFIQNQMVTGYSHFDEKLVPDVVVSGGITEFDRGLVTRGANTDVGIEAEVKGVPSVLTSTKAAIDYSDASKSGLARITLDFNLLDFKSMAGIPRMSVVSSMEVTKALAEKELGITLFGPTFGRKGTVKKVQGRHAAVRLLVEASMIQMVGKYLALPYWRLLGEDVQPDGVVVSALKKSYYRMNDATRVYLAQQWLYLLGYDMVPTGNLDEATVNALQQCRPSFAPAQGVDLETFTALYFSLPIDEKTLGRRNSLALVLQQSQSQPAATAPEHAPAQPQAGAAEAAPIKAPSGAAEAPRRGQPQHAEPQPSEPQRPAAKAESRAAQQEPPTSAKPAANSRGTAPSGKIGRMLDDSEW